MVTNRIPKNKVICITLPRSLAEKLDAAATEERRTRSNMAAVIIQKHFRNQ